MIAEGATFIVATAVSLWLTLYLGVRFEPDTSYYLAGLGLFPSPLGTFIGSCGLATFAIVHALSVGLIFGGLVWMRPPLRSILAGAPVLLWLGFLGVDALAGVLFVYGYTRGRPWALLAAGAVHLQALVLVGGTLLRRRPRAALCVVAAGVALVLLTPYRAAFAFSDLPDLLLALVLGGSVAFLGLAPGLVAGLAAWRPFVPLAAAVAASSAYAARWDYSTGGRFQDPYWGTLRYALPLSLLCLYAAAVQVDGRTERPTTAPGTRRNAVKRVSLVLGLVVLGALVVVPMAFAQTVPAIPVDEYGDSLLSSLATAIGAIFPYAAAITAFAIGVGMVKRWLGHRKATRV